MTRQSQKLIDIVEQEIEKHSEVDKQDIQLRFRAARKYLWCEIKDKQNQKQLYNDLIFEFSSFSTRKKRRQTTTEAYSYFDSQGIDCQVEYPKLQPRT